jgi:hypothetical protein
MASRDGYSCPAQVLLKSTDPASTYYVREAPQGKPYDFYISFCSGVAGFWPPRTAATAAAPGLTCGVLLPSRLELLFCAHHDRQYATALAKIAVAIRDETGRLTPTAA